MKILVINPILYTSEGNRLPTVTTIKDTMIYGMCMGFVRLGHQVTLVAVDDYRPTQHEDYDFDIRWMRDTFRRVLPPALPMPTALPSFLKREAHDYDMIIASETFAYTTLCASRLAGHKTIIWQELSAHQRKWHRWPSRLWHRCVIPIAFGKVRCVVPRSQRAHDFIARYMSPVSDRILDHGIDLDSLPVGGPKKRQFITVGQLIERKGIDTVIRRFAQFCSSPTARGFSLLVAGRGPERQALKQLAESLNIADKVQFLGFVSHHELGRLLSESVAMLVATRQDLNMVSITESVACGTPVITNTVPNTSHWVQQLQLGIAKDDWGADDMLAVIADGTYAQRCIGQRPHLSCEAVAQQFIELFEQYG